MMPSAVLRLSFLTTVTGFSMRTTVPKLMSFGTLKTQAQTGMPDKEDLTRAGREPLKLPAHGVINDVAWPFLAAPIRLRSVAPCMASGESAEDAGTVWHYEVDTGAEEGVLKLVRAEHPNGAVEYFEGEAGAEQVVRAEFSNGAVWRYEASPPQIRGTLKYGNGETYVGELKDGKKHGRGTATFSDYDGVFYVFQKECEGEWKDGKMQGWGTEKWADGSTYEGEFKDGKKHGQGTCKWPTGEKYEGQWKAGQRHGHGTNKWPSGEKYEGQWKAGQKHGQGTEKWADGFTYEGEFKDGKRHGRGTAKWAVGFTYEGEYKDGKKHGFGMHKWPTGEKYEGQWKAGLRHGHGTNKWPTGKTHEGKWKEDQIINADQQSISAETAFRLVVGIALALAITS